MKRLNNVNLTFREFDAELNKDGTISKDKLRRILSTLKVVELDIVKLFETCGLQGHVELNYTQFLEWLEDVHGPDFKVTVRPQTVREAPPSDLIVPPLDHQELINVVFSSSEGKVDSSQVTVTPNDGNGVGKHFWLSIVGSPSMPTGVALHPRAITPWEKRADGARVMFGEHELAPRRLGVCGDCFVETWEGDAPFCLVDLQACEVCCVWESPKRPLVCRSALETQQQYECPDCFHTGGILIHQSSTTATTITHNQDLSTTNSHVQGARV